MKIEYLTTFEKLGIAFNIGSLHINNPTKKPSYLHRQYNEIICGWCGSLWDKRINGENWLHMIETEPEKARKDVKLDCREQTHKTQITLESLRWFDEVLYPFCFTKFYTTKKERENAFIRLMQDYLEYIRMPQLSEEEEDRLLCIKLTPILFNLIGFYNIKTKTHRADWFYGNRPSDWFLKLDPTKIGLLINKIEYLPLLEGDIREIKKFIIKQIQLIVRDTRRKLNSKGPKGPTRGLLTNPNIVENILNRVKTRVFLSYSPPIVQSLQLRTNHQGTIID